ncbi:lysyl-tRNA synthetase [Theileria orientalis strain Shintoku]|uniref:Lysyl-tRNA synthetase n=1 Tax=Theileria orientalis strain Shintoku TaxID=869250 RepID=J4C979_THEOR|nr:lysyl-tRNA synthetase [Theileria orientalis strain Shintoku]BAM42068.1 lysyl-tRNA synthetase [Theileria orientalis strain Shintoku]|eukprot:XP_009692369.1 lysyl-tRNA synthetase [Theileria orientalis strain Shintoku]
MFLYRYYLSSILLLWSTSSTEPCLSYQISHVKVQHWLQGLNPLIYGPFRCNVRPYEHARMYRTPYLFNLNSLNLSRYNNGLNNSKTVVNSENYNAVYSQTSHESQSDEDNGLLPNDDSTQNNLKYKATDRAKLISHLCSYDDNPHLIQQIQSRLSNYEALINTFKVNPYPEVTANYYDEFTSVISENESLSNGEETEKCYKVYGRVESIRFDGHFMDIVNINRDFKNYTNAELIQKRLTRNNKLQVMFRLEEPILVDNGHYDRELSSSKDEDEMVLCKQIVGTVDIGDVLELYGNVKKTNSGEISIVPKRIKFLSKCLIPQPSKQHGLKDIETRFRLRHLDLMMNDKSRMYVLKRYHIIAKVRKFLTDNEYMEVETPILNHYGMGNLAESFETYYNKLEQKVKLRIAPEFSIKKLVLGLPFKKVFEIGKCFRNEGTSLIHSPEFTMVEIYEKMVDYNKMIQLFERIVDYVLSYDNLGTMYEVKWSRKRFDDAIEEYTGIDIKLYNKKRLEERLEELNEANQSSEQNSAEQSKGTFSTWGEVANEIFEKHVVPKLRYPVHITDMPLQISPLCYYDLKEEGMSDDGTSTSTTNSGHPTDCEGIADSVDPTKCRGSTDTDTNELNGNTDGTYGSECDSLTGDCKLFSNRFESYLGGMEVAHGCTEQCNPLILASRLVSNNGEATSEKGVETKHTGRNEVDREFMHSAFCGMEPMSGLGIGVDRLVMFATRAKNIKEIQPLPSLRKL